MKKLACLLLPLCLALDSCSVFRKSETWDKVSRTRPNVSGDVDPAKAYAAEIHRTLAGSHIEHKVVSYKFRYNTRVREDAEATSTAIIYRDDTHPENPWWIVDERTRRPVWLPNDSVDRQVDFYLQSHAQIVDVQDFSRDGSKAVVPPERPVAALRYTVVASYAMPEHKDFKALFRAKNGTAYNPRSAIDRRKMMLLQHETQLHTIAQADTAH